MIIESNAKRKLQNAEPVFFAFQCLSDPSCGEILACAGADIIAVDMEHRTMDEDRLVHTARAIQARGSACLLRTSSRDTRMIGRVLDCGLNGICATMVEGYDDAMAVVKAVKIGQQSSRGICADGRGGDFTFGVSGQQEYAEKANNSSIVFVVLESWQALQELDRIVTIPEIDCICIGPADLACSMGKIGQAQSPEVVRVIREAKEKIIACGKMTTINAVEAAQMKDLMKQGYRIFNIGSDITSIMLFLLR